MALFIRSSTNNSCAYSSPASLKRIVTKPLVGTTFPSATLTTTFSVSRRVMCSGESLSRIWASDLGMAHTDAPVSTSASTYRSPTFSDKYPSLLHRLGGV